MLFRTPGQRHPRLELLKHELAVIDNQLHQRHYLAGEVIFDEGEEGQGLFIVLSGRVKTTRQGTTRGVLLEFGPGSFFGEVALLDQSVRTAQARAIEDTSIVTLFRAEFYSLLQTHSAIASRVSFQLARMLATRLRQNILATDEHHEAS
jgi:CRP/FNR family cyclic AMP-dependent transcriptional regulator